MRILKGIAVVCFWATLANIAYASDSSQFEMGTPGYLMNACEDVLAGKSSFRAGYCFGVYSTTLSSKLIRFDVLGSEYCPTEQAKTDVNMGLIVKFIKSRPKTWHTGDDYYAVELALKDAWPCT